MEANKVRRERLETVAVPGMAVVDAGGGADDGLPAGVGDEGGLGGLKRETPEPMGAAGVFVGPGLGPGW